MKRLCFAVAVFVFTTVDAFSFEAQSCTFTITGILQGDAAASVKAVAYSCSSSSSPYSAEVDRRLQTCERMALIAMAKPGQYLFEVRPGSISSAANPACKLSRVTP
jgi:hypothetical protein